MTEDVIVGIDLGTTNSLVAIVRDGAPVILPVEDQALLPSIVGVDEQGEVIVGNTARNQYLAAPERTVRSIKRHMGEPGYQVRLGDKDYTPEEISSIILRRLAESASEQLGQPVRRAVITIPAYFADRQRQATMRAGELAGLEVVRLLHEPTAAALVYGMGKSGVENAVVYDLGGGTFDVSVVELGGGMTEVRASHGNRQLGGDDFDELIVEAMLGSLDRAVQAELRNDRIAMARLSRAAEAAKIHLSDHPFVGIREEFLGVHNGRPVHLEMELTRTEFVRLIEPLLNSTLDAVRRALRESGIDRRALDAVLLVGGSTRIPAVRDLVSAELGLEPRQNIHPDQAVALGAAAQAGALAGLDVDAVLVDITPHSLGIRALGYWNGMRTNDLFSQLIRRNTPIPVSKSEFFYTSHEDQTEASIEIYQGEDPRASRNTLLGEFMLEGLPRGGGQEILVSFDYDINGILHVSAVDRSTGKSKEIAVHTSALKEVEPASSEFQILLSRLQALDSTTMGPTVSKLLMDLLAEAPEVAAAKDPAQIESWQDRASEFLFEHGKEY